MKPVALRSGCPMVQGVERWKGQLEGAQRKVERGEPLQVSACQRTQLEWSAFG